MVVVVVGGTWRRWGLPNIKGDPVNELALNKAQAKALRR